MIINCRVDLLHVHDRFRKRRYNMLVMPTIFKYSRIAISLILPHHLLYSLSFIRKCSKSQEYITFTVNT
jgi:hypothetical protein